MTKRISASFLLGGLLAFAIAASASEPAAPNVVVVVSDTLRRDHLGCYGYERDTSPNIDSFAEDATLFELAYAQSPSTKPSMASFFVSRFPSQHQAIYNRQTLSSSFTTLAEVLKAEGYTTAGFVENPVVGKNFGFDQGFDVWLSDFRRHRRDDRHWGDRERKLDAGKTENFDGEVLAWIESNRNGKFFLYVHYVDPHSPYQAPPEFRGRYTDQEGPEGVGLKIGGGTHKGLEGKIAKYDEEIRYVDARFGSLLSRLDQLELAGRTIVIFFSDHGEGFMEHGFTHHSSGLFGELIDVPLIIRAPGRLPPGRFRLPAQHVDLFPTVLELTGIDARPYAPEGRSLVTPLTKGTGEENEQVIFSEQLRTSKKITQQAIIADDWKLIRDSTSGTVQLFHLIDDPGETKDRSASEPEKLKEMKEALRRQLERIEPGSEPEEIDLDPETREALESLGYL